MLKIILLCAVAWLVAGSIKASAGPLHEAMHGGDIAAARQLIAEGEDVEALDEAALTPLVIAALAGHRDALALLIENGADPHGRDGNGFTALHATAHAGHLELVQLLLDLGLDVDDQQNMAGLSPLHAAAERGFLEIAELLLARGATVDRRAGKAGTGHTPVIMATLNTHPKVVKLLRDHGADCSPLKPGGFYDYCMTAGN